MVVRKCVCAFYDGSWNTRPRETPPKACPKKWLFEAENMRFPCPQSGFLRPKAGQPCTKKWLFETRSREFFAKVKVGVATPRSADRAVLDVAAKPRNLSCTSVVLRPMVQRKFFDLFLFFYLPNT
jgi:hypothetical protein